MRRPQLKLCFLSLGSLISSLVPAGVPFFTIIGAVAGTFINVQAKKKALIARAKAQAKADAEKKK